MTMRDRIHRCFVEYNPLYFASAMCVFAGVWLVAEGLPAEHFASKAAVVGITEGYQFLVIGGAWLLLRMGCRRPAAILGLVALLFAMDVALNGERLFSHARTLSLAPGMRARLAIPASLLFAALGPIKLALLARVFRLSGSRSFLATAGLVVFALPLLPYALEAAGSSDDVRRLAHLFIFWLGAPLLGWALTRPAWTLGDVEEPRARRIAWAAPALVAGMFLVHGVMWSTYPSLRMTAAHAAPFVLVVFTLWADRLGGRRAELAAWTGSLLALAAASRSGALPLGVMAVISGGAMLALVQRRDLRLLLPAIVSVIGGAFLISGGRYPGASWTLTACAALTMAAAGRRDLRCLAASGLALAAALVETQRSVDLVPHGLMAGALWVAATSWLLFPERRSWLPCAALAAFLAAATWPLLREPAPNSFAYLGVALLAGSLGFAYRWLAYKLTGTAGLVTLAVVTHSIYAPRSPLSWGLLLLGFGFVFLAAGLAVNLRLRSTASEASP